MFDDNGSYNARFPVHPNFSPAIHLKLRKPDFNTLASASSSLFGLFLDKMRVGQSRTLQRVAVSGATQPLSFEMATEIVYIAELLYLTIPG